jgi:uncharacterized protein
MFLSNLSASLVALGAASVSSSAPASCLPGIYGLDNPKERVVVVLTPSIPAPGKRYLFVDGRRGSTLDPSSPVVCEGAAPSVRLGDGSLKAWPRIQIVETATEFHSFGTKLVGRLIEPIGSEEASRPLVVMVHGSERSPAIGNPYPYALAAQGVAVFVFDKRGTGESQGEYTQNFELLADDAAAAFRHATTLAKGRHGRAGYFGGSQGGWVAPLAATRTPAQFVAVAFGLMGSPIDEDREQMLLEARTAGLNADSIASINQLSSATARILRSRFSSGFNELEAVRRQLKGKPWADSIKGEYSGDMLRMSDADLRRIGRARFDNLELIWDHDAAAVLRKLRAPLLWVLADQDREAPVDATRKALLALTTRGGSIDVVEFPGTDHGMFEFIESPDGSRHYTRITEGYLKLLADWIGGRVGGTYGRSKRLR